MGTGSVGERDVRCLPVNGYCARIACIFGGRESVISLLESQCQPSWKSHKGGKCSQSCSSPSIPPYGHVVDDRLTVIDKEKASPIWVAKVGACVDTLLIRVEIALPEVLTYQVPHMLAFLIVIVAIGEMRLCLYDCSTGTGCTLVFSCGSLHT